MLLLSELQSIIWFTWWAINHIQVKYLYIKQTKNQVINCQHEEEKYSHSL